jgi:hypothetical protein
MNTTGPEFPDATRTAWWRRAWWCLPIILALAVAASQVYLAKFCGLSPSKGGGFGLFSTVDKLENRNLRAYLLLPNGREAVFALQQRDPKTEELRKPIYRAASLPSEGHLRVILNELLTTSYKHEGSSVEVPIRGIRIEVWKMAFDRETLRARREAITKVAFDKSGNVMD